MTSLRHGLGMARASVAVDPVRFVDDVYRYALARRLGREDAEDLAIEVVQQAPRKADPSELRMYMIGMVRRKVADHFRRRRPVAVAGERDSGTWGAVEQMLDVERALGELSDSHRECLILKYVTGLSSEEIALVMSLSSEAVDSLLQRARKAFAKEWEVMHGEEADAR